MTTLAILAKKGLSMCGTRRPIVYVVLLRNTVTQMVYKHAISTIVPGRAVNFSTVETAEGSNQ